METSEYYDNMTPDEWKPVLGEDLNFHFGFYRDGTAFEEGLRLATRRLLRFLPASCRVLDLGCGWGGPARELIKNGYDVVCATNSASQYDYCRSLGLNVSFLDMERDAIECLGAFDAALMMESLDHVFDKPALLSRLAQVTSRVVFVTNCSAVSIGRPLGTFGDTMCMISSDVLLRMLEKTGWNVRFASDVRKFSMPTFEHWKTRIEAADPGINKPPLRLLHSLCEIALQDVRGFQEAFPLLTVCAELQFAKDGGL